MLQTITFLSVLRSEESGTGQMSNILPEVIAQKKYKTIQKVPQLQPPWFVIKLETLKHHRSGQVNKHCQSLQTLLHQKCSTTITSTNQNLSWRSPDHAAEIEE